MNGKCCLDITVNKLIPKLQAIFFLILQIKKIRQEKFFVLLMQHPP